MTGLPMPKKAAWMLVVGLALASGYFTMTVIIRGESLEVPPVVGMSMYHAQSVLEGKRLRLRERDRRFDSSILQGHIVSQDPLEGELVKRGRTVWVVVSKGSQVVQAPDVRGQSLQQAKVKLQLNGLSLGRIARVESRLSVDTVVAQTPEPPSLVGRGSSVSLLLSAGPAERAFLMPDLSQRSLAQVKRALGRTGIFRRKIHYQPHDDVRQGRIIQQFPSPGAKVLASDVVELIVSEGSFLQEPRPLIRQLPMKFEVPRDGASMRQVRIVLVDDEGERVLLNEVREAGSFIELRPKVRGEAFLEIYLDNNSEPIEEIKS